MDTRLELANKIMKEAKEYTNWGFSVVEQEDSYLVGAQIKQKITDQELSTVFRVNNDGIDLMMVCNGCYSVNDYNFYYLRELPYEVKASGTDDGRIKLETCISIEEMESDTHAVIIEKINFMFKCANTLIRDTQKMREYGMFSIQKGFSFTVRYSYENVKELVRAFDEYGLEPMDIEYLVTGHKIDGSDNRYFFEFSCGFQDYGQKYSQFSLEDEIEGGDDALEAYVLDMIESNFDDMYWSDTFRVYRDDDDFGFYFWRCIHERELESIRNEVRMVEIHTKNENGKIITEYHLKTDDQVHVFQGNEFESTCDEESQEYYMDGNYEIYLGIASRIYGRKLYRNMDKLVPFESYEEMVKKELENAEN